MICWLRSVRNSFASRVACRAVCFQSIVRRSMPGAKLRQRVELRAVTDVALHVETEERVALKQAQRFLLDGVDIGGDRNGSVEPLDPLLPDETERALPAHPEAVQPPRTPAQRAQTEANAALRILERNAAAQRLGAKQPVRVERELGAPRRQDGREIRLKQRLSARTDRKRRRQFALDPHLGSPPAQQRVGGNQTQHEQDPGNAHEPQAGRGKGRDERQRRAEKRKHDGAARRIDHRGASMRSTIAISTSSTRRPSISAAGDSTTRWRKAGSVNALMSSGMT